MSGYTRAATRGFTLGLTDGFETLAVETFYFQRSKQSLAGSVIPTVSLAAHRSGDATLQKQAAELTAGVLAAAVAMEDRSRSSVGTAPQPGHLQCIDDQIAIQQVGCDRQAVSVVGCGDTVAPLAPGADPVLLHCMLRASASASSVCSG